jgi:YHS domain-containing protein
LGWVSEPRKNAAPGLNLPVLNLPVLNLPGLNKRARDPVCGMFVSVVGAKYKSAKNGNEIYFCCAACKQTFERPPEKDPLSIPS